MLFPFKYFLSTSIDIDWIIAPIKISLPAYVVAVVVVANSVHPRAPSSGIPRGTPARTHARCTCISWLAERSGSKTIHRSTSQSKRHSMCQAELVAIVIEIGGKKKNKCPFYSDFYYYY